MANIEYIKDVKDTNVKQSILRIPLSNIEYIKDTNVKHRVY